MASKKKAVPAKKKIKSTKPVCKTCGKELPKCICSDEEDDNIEDDGYDSWEDDDYFEE